MERFLLLVLFSAAIQATMAQTDPVEDPTSARLSVPSSSLEPSPGLTSSAAAVLQTPATSTPLPHTQHTAAGFVSVGSIGQTVPHTSAPSFVQEPSVRVQSSTVSSEGPVSVQRGGLVTTESSSPVRATPSVFVQETAAATSSLQAGEAVAPGADRSLHTASSVDINTAGGVQGSVSVTGQPLDTQTALTTSSVAIVQTSEPSSQRDQLTVSTAEAVRAPEQVVTPASVTDVNAMPISSTAEAVFSSSAPLTSSDDAGVVRGSSVHVITSPVTPHGVPSERVSTPARVDIRSTSSFLFAIVSSRVAQNLSFSVSQTFSSSHSPVVTEIFSSEIPTSIQSSSQTGQMDTSTFHPVFSSSETRKTEDTPVVSVTALLTSTSSVLPLETATRTQTVVIPPASSLSPSSSLSEEMMTSSMHRDILSLHPATSVATPSLDVTSSVVSVIATMPSTSPLSTETSVPASSSAVGVTAVFVHPTTTTSVMPTTSAPVLPTISLNTTTIITTTPAPTTTTNTSTAGGGGGASGGSSTPRVNTTTTTTTTTTTESATKTVRYMFVLSGDCHLVLNNSEYFARFLAAFHDLLTKQLRIPDNTYRLGEVTCGSVRIYVTFMNVLMPEFDVMIQTAIHSRGQGLIVPVWIDGGQFMTFEVTHAEQVELKPEVTDTYNVVTKVMDDVDIIVIVVACCVCAVLVSIGIAICVKECYRRKYAQSFDLLEIPHVNLKLEDFTLTRIPRPKTIYTEASAVTMKSFAETGGGGGQHQNGSSFTQGLQSTGSNGHTRTPSINAEDMHVRVRSHSQGIVIGITSSHHANSAAHEDPYSNGALRRSKSRTPSGDDHPEEEYQASERLLGGRGHGDMDGTVNPVFLDDAEGEEGRLGEEGMREVQTP